MPSAARCFLSRLFSPNILNLQKHLWHRFITATSREIVPALVFTLNLTFRRYASRYISVVSRGVGDDTDSASYGTGRLHCPQSLISSLVSTNWCCRNVSRRQSTMLVRLLHSWPRRSLWYRPQLPIISAAALPQIEEKTRKHRQHRHSFSDTWNPPPSRTITDVAESPEAALSCFGSVVSVSIVARLGAPGQLSPSWTFQASKLVLLFRFLFSFVSPARTSALR